MAIADRKDTMQYLLWQPGSLEVTYVLSSLYSAARMNGITHAQEAGICDPIMSWHLVNCINQHPKPLPLLTVSDSLVTVDSGFSLLPFLW